MNKKKILKNNLILIGIALLVIIISISILFVLLREISNEIKYINNREKSCKIIKFPPYVVFGYNVYRMNVVTTAYSSTVNQCDNNPFITAYGTKARNGIVACNFLPFGTKIRFPEIYNNKIFTVEDRMADNTMIDIWFPDKQSAINFGKKTLLVEIIE